MTLTIDPQFKALIPPLSTEEFALLESNILRDGCRDPLTVWGETLLDGHNRHEICTKHSLPYQTFLIDLPDREAAMDWMDANQLGRRNLSREAHDLLLGRRYNRTKKARGNEPGVNHKGESVKDQNDTSQNAAAKLATEHGVSEATVKRAGQFAEAVEAQGLEADAMAGKLKGKKKEVVESHRKATGKIKEEPQEEEPEPVIEDGVTEKPKLKMPSKIIEDEGMNIWLLAKSHLDRINKHDTQREQALKACAEYCQNRISSKK